MTKIKYVNRYDEVFYFTILNHKSILWEGDFKLIRGSNLLDFTKSYHLFQKEHASLNLSFDEFIKKIEKDFSYKNKGNKSYQEAEKYHLLGTPIKDSYYFVDPTGGPYIGIGTPIRYILESFPHSYEVGEILKTKEGFLINLK